MIDISNNTTYKLHVVAGPTASGKTDYAIKLAQQLNGELINIDSRQVYKDMDIGTNKGDVKPEGQVKILARDYPQYTFSDGTVINLLSFLTPDQQFNIYDFRTLVYGLVPEIVSRGKTPILVGGSGLYLASIMDPQKYQLTSAKFNPEHRQKLESMSVAELQELLAYTSKTAFEALNDSDKANKRRLIRKIEILSAEGELDEQTPITISVDADIHYMDVPIEELEARISSRVEQMFAAGFVNEVKTLLEKYSLTAPALQGIGYAEVIDYLQDQDNIALEECIRDVQIAHRQYAKKQITWFKKYLVPMI